MTLVSSKPYEITGLEKYDDAGDFAWGNIFGNYIDEALAFVIPAQAGIQTYYFLHDHLYSPAVLIGYDEENEIWIPVERYEYNAYGTVSVINHGPDDLWFTTDDVVTGSSAINTTLFTGRTLDSLDSANLKIMYYRHRYTDPFTGRFLQEDPMGVYPGESCYAYCGFHPINKRDPWGLFTIEPMNKPLWKKGNTEHEYMDGAYMGIFLFPDVRERAIRSGVIIQRRNASWNVKLCSSGIPWKSGKDIVSFINPFDLDNPHIHHKVTSEVDPDSENPVLMEDRIAMDYAALMHLEFNSPDCTTGEIQFVEEYLVYPPIWRSYWDSERWDNKKTHENPIAQKEYEHKSSIQDHVHIPARPATLSRGTLRVNISWKCKQEPKITIGVSGDATYVRPNGYLNTRHGRSIAQETPRGWVPFSDTNMIRN